MDLSTPVTSMAFYAGEYYIGTAWGS